MRDYYLEIYKKHGFRDLVAVRDFLVEMLNNDSFQPVYREVIAERMSDIEDLMEDIVIGRRSGRWMGNAE